MAKPKLALIPAAQGEQTLFRTTIKWCRGF